LIDRMLEKRPQLRLPDADAVLQESSAWLRLDLRQHRVKESELHRAA